jgi:hypothetical protein
VLDPKVRGLGSLGVRPQRHGKPAGCRFMRASLISLLERARYVPNLDNLCIPFRSELIHCSA